MAALRGRGLQSLLEHFIDRDISLAQGGARGCAQYDGPRRGEDVEHDGSGGLSFGSGRC